MEYKILRVSKDDKDKAIKQPYRPSALYCQCSKDPRAKAEETFKVKSGSLIRVDPLYYDAQCEGQESSCLNAQINPGYWPRKLPNFPLQDLIFGHHNLCRLLFTLT